jgi:hypothetical protein
MEAIKNSRDQLMENVNDWRTIRKETEDQFPEALAEWNEKLSDNADIIDHYGSVLEGYRNIIDIVGKDTLGISDEIMDTLNRTRVSNANDQLKASKEILEANKSTLAIAEENLAKAKERGNQGDIDYWTKQVEKATKSVNEAEQEFMDDWENAL